MGVWVRERDRIRLVYFSAGVTTPNFIDFGVAIRPEDRSAPQVINQTVTSFTEDRTAVVELADEDVSGDGEIFDAWVTGNFPGVNRGELYASLTVRSGNLFKIVARGYIDEMTSLRDEVFDGNLEGSGRLVKNESDTTLGNNNTVTRTITTPTNTRWRFMNGLALNADDVARAIDYAMTDGTDPVIQWLRQTDQATTTPAGERINVPVHDPTQGDQLDAAGSASFLMDEADTISITWNAGGASAGGTAKSSAVLEEWIAL